jgi:type IX secretion system PorP/SprF family membrane protein
VATNIMNLKNKLKILLIVLSLIMESPVFSQDVHFSQFHSSPLFLNPAFTGNYDGDWRIMQNYRTQWSAVSDPYKTISVGFDKPIYILNQKFGLGLFIINDNSGINKLTVNKIFLCTGYHLVRPESSLSFGLQAGYVLNSFAKDKLTLPEQFNMETGFFDSKLPNNENFSENVNYFDMNLGLLWKKKLGAFEPEIGISLFHVTFPNASYLSANNKIPLRQCIHGATRIDIDKKLFLLPKIMYMGEKIATDLIYGSEIGYNLPKNAYNAKSAFAGIFIRNGLTNMDACVLVLGVNLKALDIGVSYDLNISKLRTASSYRGAFEFSIIFTAASTKINKIALPLERF